MKTLIALSLAVLAAGPALAGVPDPDCPNRRRNTTRTVYVRESSSTPNGGWTYQGYNEYLGY